MKKLSSVFYMWVGLGFGLLAVLMMFVPFVKMSGDILAAKSLFFGNEVYGGAWPSFVGFMFILVGALMMGIMALPMIQPSSQTEKIVLISAGVLLLVGGILVGLIHVLYEANANSCGQEVSPVLDPRHLIPSKIGMISSIFLPTKRAATP